MINETIRREIEEQMKILKNNINNQFVKYLNTITTFISNLFNKFLSVKNNSENNHTNSVSHFQQIKTIKEGNTISSICFLNDGRLVSGEENYVFIYNMNTHQVDIKIYQEFDVYDICKLKNGNFVTCGAKSCFDDTFGDAYIYEINGNDYNRIHKLEGHSKTVYKVIELEDGRLCSCSADKTIKIWDNNNNYQCTQTFKDHDDGSARNIVEMNNYLISLDNENTLKLWNKSAYESIKTLKLEENIYRLGRNRISKLTENRVIIGGEKTLYVLDVPCFEYKSYKTDHLGNISNVCVVGKNKILLGNTRGIIHCFDLSSYQIIFSQRVLNEEIISIIKTEDNKIYSCSEDRIIMFILEFY